MSGNRYKGAGSITAGTNEKSRGGAFGTAKPRSANFLRNSRRQVNNCDEASPCLRATAQAVSAPE